MAAPGACLASRSPPAFLAGGFLAARPAAVSPIPSRSGTDGWMGILGSQEPSSASSKKRPPLRRGKISPQLPVPEHIPRPSYVGSNRPQELSSVRQIHSAEGIAGMRAACKLAARALDFAGTLIKPSVTTNEIDREVHNMIIEAGAYPSQLGYGGFPKSICTSLNECVCHGVPDSTQLQTGDIMNVDVNVFLNGYHGGASRTFVCGEVDDSIRHFLKAAEECLEKGITVCRDGVNYKKIGKKISKLAYFYGYYVVDRFVGHGIGPIWHSEPLILHHANDNSGRMVEGQTFTIEPILTMEKAETVTWEDGWTTVTADGSWAAQFKHTVHMWQDYRSQAEELIDEICDESSVPGEWLVRRVCGSLEFCVWHTGI
uniref:Methionine aminopeptidase n=1 Tax=Oryza barthii TaxID=65489 RepID=A0A0D3GRG7_9ORYZ